MFKNAAVALLALLASLAVAAPAQASSYSFPDQAPMDDATSAEMIENIEGWWTAAGYPACTGADGLRMMTAPDLQDAGGRSAECDVWMLASTRDHALDLGDPLRQGWLAIYCSQTVHELGHTAIYLAKLDGRLPADLEDHPWLAQMQPAWEAWCVQWASNWTTPGPPRKGSVPTAPPVASAADARTRSSLRADARRFQRRVRARAASARR